MGIFASSKENDGLKLKEKAKIALAICRKGRGPRGGCEEVADVLRERYPHLRGARCAQMAWCEERQGALWAGLSGAMHSATALSNIAPPTTAATTRPACKTAKNSRKKLFLCSSRRKINLYCRRGLAECGTNITMLHLSKVMEVVKKNERARSLVSVCELKRFWRVAPRPARALRHAGVPARRNMGSVTVGILSGGSNGLKHNARDHDTGA